MNTKNNNQNKFIENDENIIDFMKIDNIETNPEKYKLQCMLPDYVFNKLAEQEKIEFENAINNYPDLKKEVNDAKALFSHIEKFDYKKMMYDKSQYLPDRVVANLEKRNQLHKQWKPSWKRLIATAMLGAIILGYFYFTNKNKQTFDTPQHQDAIEIFADFEIFTDEEKEMIAENLTEITFDDINIFPTLMQEILSNNNVDLQDFEDYYITTINAAVKEAIQSGGTISYYLQNDYMYFLEELEYVDEEFFQALLNRISNL